MATMNKAGRTTLYKHAHVDYGMSALLASAVVGRPRSALLASAVANVSLLSWRQTKLTAAPTAC